MKKLIALIASILIFVSACEDKGSKHVKIPERIISLSPHTTEIIYALNRQDRLIAVSDFCIYPPEAEQKEKIGGLLNPNIEKILLLKPQLIIGTPAHSEIAEKLKQTDIKFILLNNDSVNDALKTIDSLGAVLNAKKNADSLQNAIQDSLSFYEDKARQNFTEKTGAMLVIGRDAGTTRNITVAGPNTFLTSIWERVGGINSFNDLPARYAQVNREALLTKNPDIIIEFRFNESWNRQKDMFNLNEWQSLGSVKAVSNGHIYVLTGDYTLIPGPRLHLLARDYYRILSNFYDKK